MPRLELIVTCGKGAPVPGKGQVRARYESWLQTQASAGQTFSDDQRRWLDHIVAHIGVNLSVTANDLTSSEFFNRGGLLKARQVFEPQLPALLDELNTVLI